jgi:hypothetical protein
MLFELLYKDCLNIIIISAAAPSSIPYRSSGTSTKPSDLATKLWMPAPEIMMSSTPCY